MNRKFLFSLLLVVMIFAGCISIGGTTQTEQTIEKEETKTTAVRPSINIIVPLDDAVIKTEGDFTDIEVSVETNNLLLKTPGGKNSVGEGNIVYSIDGGDPIVSVNKKVVFSKVGLGEHKISVEIRQNDQTSYYPKIVKSASFKVEKISTQILPTNYEVLISKSAFSPSVIYTHPGDDVTWKNSDIMPHTATSTGNFDTGTITSGASKTLTFTKEGTFNYQCMINPAIKGTVVVYTGDVKPTVKQGITVAVVKFRDNQGQVQLVYNRYNGELIGDSLEVPSGKSVDFQVNGYNKTIGSLWVNKGYTSASYAAYLYIGSASKEEVGGPMNIGEEFNLGWTNIRLEEVVEK